MKLFDYIDESLFNQMLKDNWIFEQAHPDYPNLKIVCYTKMCQMNKIWNSVTEKCRGLIYDSSDNEILAIPYKKFFNLEEYDDISDLPINCKHKLYEKLDGSLGILYWIGDVPYIATKGSFVSEQALHATKILHEKYGDKFDRLDRNITYLFEIIYPEDLHVVFYKDIDDIVLTGAVSLETGEDISIESIPDDLFNKTKTYDIDDWMNARNMFEGEGREGFVVRFDNGFRLKLKYQWYWKLHFLKAGLSKNKILEAVINGQENELTESIKMFDEEQQIYYFKHIDEIHKLKEHIEKTVKAEYQCLIDEHFNEDRRYERREYAEIFKKSKNACMLFALLDRRQDKFEEYVLKEVKNLY